MLYNDFYIDKNSTLLSMKHYQHTTQQVKLFDDSISLHLNTGLQRWLKFVECFAT